MNHSEEELSTLDKALKVNLDPRRYGTFAEIGAGQEVVRWFFRAGAAAGTISKSISAYDMKVSDAIYGQCERYVCRSRLESMLKYEQDLNIDRLHDERGDATAFFTFADTVSARNFHGTNECHGWLGMRLQAHPRDECSQIIIHVRMLDKTNALQQEALGIIGVNLIYGACMHHHNPEYLIESLLDNLSTARIEIDMIEFSGIEFRHVDNRLMSLKLVQLGLTNAAMFGAGGKVLQPSEVLRKRAVLVERGSFRPVCNSNIDIMRCAYERFCEEPGVEKDSVIQLMEITMRNLMADGQIDYRDFLARADMLVACGMTVLISDYFEYYRLAAYLSRYTRSKIGISMGISSLQELFNEKYYTELDGGILESFGRLFKNDLKLYVYPFKNQATGEICTTENIEIAEDLKKLYGYLIDRGCIEQLHNYDPNCLNVFSRDVLTQISNGDNMAWESMVPVEVAEVIKKHGFFGYGKTRSGQR
ncbi:MAG: TonB-dependent receptor [Verrucomicrobiales bacterium]|nr:TonB-dependent receptor [Verrucomicrobiae bacterium]